MAPHVIPKADPRQKELVAQVDAATGALMRAILTHPDFQALEAAWRSVFFLLQRLETGVELKLYAIDITREEMRDATSSGHPQLIAREGWSAAVCLHFFLPHSGRLRHAGKPCGLARKAGGPLLAGMDPRLMGCESMAATPDPDDWKHRLDEPGWRAWQELRRPSRRLLARPGDAAHSVAPAIRARHFGGRGVRVRRDARAARPRSVSLGAAPGSPWCVCWGRRSTLAAGKCIPECATSSTACRCTIIGWMASRG